MSRLMSSSIDPYGLERFRVQALIELLEAGALSGIPITLEDEERYADLQQRRDKLDAYREEENHENRNLSGHME